MTLTDVQEGETIMVSLYGQQARPATVTNVARKYLTAGGSQFDRETGKLRGQYAGDAVTVEQHEENVQRQAIITGLRQHGVEILRSSLSLRQLQAIAAVVEAGA